MNAKELKALLLKVPDNIKVYFDSEAVCFDTHLVEIDSASYMTKEESGMDEDAVVLSWSMQTEKFHWDKS